MYGDRTGHGYGSETTIRTPTWRDQPQQLLSLLKPYLDPDVDPPAVQRQRARQEVEVYLETLERSCGNPQAMAEFRDQLTYARKVYTVLETHNHYIDQMATGQLRQATLAAADWLVVRGDLPTRDDIFWFSFEEILAALRNDRPSLLANIVASRQARHTEWQQLQAPPFLGIPEAHLPDRPTLADERTPEPPLEPGRLTGQGASSGTSRGQARVVLSGAATPEIEPGQILVANNVGPRWAPLFPIMGGLVLDGGSLGQHAAATAREYGIPAVIGTKHATKHIPEGAWLKVDGTTGTVLIETPP